MYTKALSSILPQRIRAAKKFPQLRLSTKAEKKVLHHKPFEVKLSFFDFSNLEFIKDEVDEGHIVEVRKSNSSLVGLGFFEPSRNSVDMFEWSNNSVSAPLTVVDEDFFIGRLEDAIEKREKGLPKLNNTFRAVHGAEDGLPSLYVDQFSPRFYAIRATSYGANRLLPPLAEFLRQRGAEELMVESPTLHPQKITLSAPTIHFPSHCLENGITFNWSSGGAPFSELICCGYRQSRRFLRDVTKGKRVLCLHDQHGMAALNAALEAEKVVCVSEDTKLLQANRHNLLYNHGEPIFQRCETLECTIQELSFTVPFDVVFIEHHDTFLFSEVHWKETISSLRDQKLLHNGTVLITCHSSSKDFGFNRAQQCVCSCFSSSDLRCKCIQSFSSSLDFPKTRSLYSPYFSHVFRIEVK